MTPAPIKKTMTTSTPVPAAGGAAGNVRESSRYRRRAQEAERQAAQLQDELARTSAEAERQLAELQTQLQRAEAERRRTMQQLADSQFDLQLQRHLTELGTSDLELAALAARKIMADEQLTAAGGNVTGDVTGDVAGDTTGAIDPRELARRVLREKPLLRAPNYQPSDSTAGDDDRDDTAPVNAGEEHEKMGGMAGCHASACRSMISDEGGMATLAVAMNNPDENDSAGAMNNPAENDSAGATHKLVCGCAGATHKLVCGCADTPAGTAGNPGTDDAASNAANTQENATVQAEAENAPADENDATTSQISPGAPVDAEARPRHSSTNADGPLPELGYGSRPPRTSPASHMPARRMSRLAHQARCSGNRGDLAAYLRARRHS